MGQIPLQLLWVRLNFVYSSPSSLGGTIRASAVSSVNSLIYMIDWVWIPFNGSYHRR